MLLQLVYVLSLLCLLQETYCQYSSNDGPRFLQQPKDTFILQTNVPIVTIDCFAVGIPQPTYEWIKWTADNQSLSINNYPRYSYNFGSLIIENPTLADEGTYQCKASNIYGTIISTEAKLTILELGEFSNVPPAPKQEFEHYGAELQCPGISFSYSKSVLSYNWYKDYVFNWINPVYQNTTFISAKGKLFISELSPQDNGKYYCQVFISTSMLEGNIIGNNEQQKTALPIELKVLSYDPSIELSIIPPEDFLHVQPSTPLKGSRMRIECFFYGPGQLVYTWYREDGKPLPANSSFENNNRVLVVDNVGLEDGGHYYCQTYSTSLQRGYSNGRYIVIEAKPYFTIQLTSPQLEPGSRLIWYCEADGIPATTYTWYKNGVALKSSSRMTVDMKTLTIDAVNDKEDNGMYQCEARNIHGSVFSTARLQIPSDIVCVGCSRGDINYGSLKLFSVMLAMILFII